MLDRDARSTTVSHDGCRLAAQRELLVDAPIIPDLICAAALVPAAEVLGDLAGSVPTWVPVVAASDPQAPGGQRAMVDDSTSRWNEAVHELAHAVTRIALARRGRPRRVHVPTEQLAIELGSELEMAGITVTSSPPPTPLDAVGLVESRLAHAVEELLAAPELATEAMRRLHAALVRLGDANPWAMLAPVDFIRAETSLPGVDWPWFAFTQVDGEPTVFMASSAEHLATIGRQQTVPEHPEGIWRVRYPALEDAPLSMRHIATRLGHGCTRDGRLVRMTLVHSDGQPGRQSLPSENQVSLIEALAQIDEARLDRGRWSTVVQGADGPVEMTLSWPDRLKPPTVAEWLARGHSVQPSAFAVVASLVARMKRRGETSLPSDPSEFDSLETALDRLAGLAATPAEEAGVLCARAALGQGRLRWLGAREAIERHRDCPDAWVILAEGARDNQQGAERLREAIAAGERLVAAEAASGLTWHSRELASARSAHRALAWLLAERGDRKGADALLLRLLELAPADLEARMSAVPVLLRSGDTAGALEVAEGGTGTGAAESVAASWARAVAGYLARGATPQVRAWLDEAVHANPLTARALLDPEVLRDPRELPRGTESMAISAAMTWQDFYVHVKGRPGFFDEVRESMRRERDRLTAPKPQRKFKPRPAHRR